MIDRIGCSGCLLLALALCGCWGDSGQGASSSGRARQRDVVLITVDTLRADHVGLYGYARRTTPNLDRWFSNAAVYLRAYSTDASTPQSVVSLLSGLLPQEHGVRIYFQLLGAQVRLVPELLPAAYQTAGFVSNMLLTDEALGIASRFRHYDDFVDEQQHNRDIFERNAARTTDAVLAWLRNQSEPKRPLFLWVHYMDPHGPYHPPPEWPLSFRHARPVEIDIHRVSPYQRIPGVTDGLTYVDRYDEEIAYADAEIGRLLDGYSTYRSLEDALLIFTADHGETMMEHEHWFTHGYHVYDSIVRVPLLVSGPGVSKRNTTLLASGIDIAPTILKFAGAKIGPQMPDVDLRTGAGISPERVVFAEGRELVQHRAAVQGDHKWMVAVNPANRAIAWRRFYGLSGDPGELHPRPWRSEEPAAKKLLALCRSDPDPGGVPQSAKQGTKLSAPKIAPRASAEVRERLRALGYAESD